MMRFDIGKSSELRSLLYLSKATNIDFRTGLSPDLTGIIVHARNKNRERQIGGMLSFNNGYFMQIVEGERVDVEVLLEDLKTDPRHQDLRIVFDGSVESRYFDHWMVKMSAGCDTEPAFQQFVKDHLSPACIERATADVLLRFTKLIKMDKVLLPNITNKEYMLTSWPRFDKITPTPGLLAICAMLKNNWLSYTQLLGTNPCHDQTELDQVLALLTDLPICRTRHKSAEAGMASMAAPKSAADGFFGKMMSFLHRFAA